MLTLWNPYRDFGFGNLRRAWSVMDELRRELDRAYTEPEAARAPEPETAQWSGWPRTGMRDMGESLVVWADVPGLSEKDVQVTVTGNSVTLSGERQAEVPEGYVVHRKERGSIQFSRSFFLPVKVDPDKAQATVKNGVLELTLPKAPEAQPKQITVKAN